MALDVADVTAARDIVATVGERAGTYKIGLELAFSGGLALVEELKARGHAVFLDVKLLDISQTVERAVAQIAKLGVDYVTVHGHDAKTLAAAVRGRGDAPLRLLAVTVMTHLDQDDLSEQGITAPLAALVERRAGLADASGVDGIVASAREAALLRTAIGSKPLIVTPGIRPTGMAAGDQVRVTTPGDAIAAGADLLVVGRPITQSADPGGAAAAILEDIEAAARVGRGGSSV